MTAATIEAPGRFQLRPYQLEALERIAELDRSGVRSVLGVAATGLGKTVIFVELVRRRGGRGLILAHRDELIGQAVAKVCEADPDRPVTAAAYEALEALGRFDLVRRGRIIADGSDAVGIVRAGADDVGAGIVVASVQTLARPARMARLVSAGRFETVVIDEAHHARADSYLRIIGALEAGEMGGPFLLGVTATPERGDGRGLSDIFETIGFDYGLLWGIRAGYLCDVRARRVELAGFDESALRVSRGDFTAASSGRALEAADAPANIVRAWQQEAAGRRTLVFTPTVAVAEAVADEFQRAGVRAGWVCGETVTEERHRLLGAFSADELDVMSNCAVLTEGYDDPGISCIVVARPTKSQALYVQMVGRGTRRHPGKTDLLVLDVVGATDQHSLITLASLFGLEEDQQVREGVEGVAEAAERHEAELVEAGQLAARDADLFRQIDTSPIAWAPAQDPKTGADAYVRTLGAVNGKRLPTVWLIRRQPDRDEWVCGLVTPDGRKRVLIDRVPLERAQAQGEDFVRKAPVSAALTSRGAPWRAGPPSARMAGFARRLGLDPSGLAGEVSDRIDAELAERAGRKKVR